MTEVSGYCRRVSFNNVHPDDEAPSRFFSYSFADPTSPTSTDPPRLFGNYTFTHKRLKLPDPPSKSILKNKLSQQQLSDNIARASSLGVSYHGDLNDLVECPPESVPRSELAVVIGGDNEEHDNENAIEDDSETTSPRGSVSAASPPAGGFAGLRRKSYSGMTDEELMALDPQFNKPRTSDISSFKFDSTQTYYKASPRRSSINPAAVVQAKQIIYPSSNENNYPSISITSKHEDYDHNISTTRKLLTVLSGRRHTWNSLDWLLQTNCPSESGVKEPGFLQNGDYLIVAALVPLKYFNAQTQRKKNALDEKLYKKCESLLDYILHSLPDPSLCLKITVEFVIDVPPADPMTLGGKKAPHVGTKFMLDHIFKQYSPNLVIVGNKSTNLNFKYPMRKTKHSSSVSGTPSMGAGLSLSKLPSAPTMSHREDEHESYLIKLSSYAIKYSPVPVIVVGTNNTASLQKAGSKTMVTFSVSPQKPSLEPPSPHPRKNSSTSTASIESFSGLPQDSGSLSSSSQSSQLMSMSDKLQDALTSSSESKFQDMVALISTSSLTESKDYLAAINDNSNTAIINLNSKVHQVYQSYAHTRKGSNLATRTMSNGSNGKPYKVKSLISYSEEEEKKNEKILNDKRLKKSLSQSSGTSASSNEKKLKKKKSFLQKIGLKK